MTDQDQCIKLATEFIKQLPVKDLDSMLHMHYTNGHKGIKEFILRKALDEISDRIANNDLTQET